MQILISHRGNTKGPDEALENNPEHIKRLLSSNPSLHVEIDVWFKDGLLLLGHDSPQYIINHDFLLRDRLWCHAKNLQALEYMLQYNITNCFWHQEDDFTLTTSGFIWTYPNKSVTKKSIIVDTSKDWKNNKYNCYGVCVDYL